MKRLFRVRAEGAGVVPVLFEDVYDASETGDLGEHTLPHGERLSGIAVDASGNPLAGAEVSLEPGVAGGDDLAFRVVTRTVVTGEDGKFQFDEASALGNRITIEKAGLAPALQTGLRAGAIPRPIAVVAGDPVTGVVLGAGRKPVAGALVRLESAEGDDALGRDGRGGTLHDPARARRARRDRRGRRRRRLGTPAGRQAAPRRGQIAHDHARSARVARRQGRRRQDRAASCRARRSSLKANGFARLVRTGPDGTYHLKGIPPQTYRFTVDEARYVPWARPDLALAPGEAKRLDVARHARSHARRKGRGRERRPRGARRGARSCAEARTRSRASAGCCASAAR